MILYIDASIAGISGDMVLAALLDIGGHQSILEEVGEKIAEETGCMVRINVTDVRKKDIRAKRVAVEAEGGMDEDGLRGALESLIIDLNLSRGAGGFAERALETLLEAEKEVHAAKKAHLHEVGSADTLVDILGTAKLLEDLGFFTGRDEVYASPVAIGSGEVKTSHGSLPIPPPVTAEILRKTRMPFKFSRAKRELATPTGVSILSGLSPVYGYPSFPVRIKALGVGAGGYDLREVPNILRAMILASEPETERIAVLKTSVDDVSGEVLGYLIERMYAEGALDVQITPTVTKKNRPGYVIVVLCSLGKELGLAETLMKETGSLGVRVSTDQMRYAAEREIREIKISLPGYEGSAKVKIAAIGRGVHVKAEYEDAKKIAKAANLPIKEVMRRIEEEARRTIT